MNARILRDGRMHRTERESAGSTSIGGRVIRIHPALPRSVLCILRRPLFLLFAICFSVCAQTTPGVDYLTKDIETGRYTEAEATAKKLLLKTPDNGPVRHELAEVFSLTGRYTEAI